MNTRLRPLYFDTAASTQVAAEVLAKMVEVLSSNNGFANPSSTIHLPGQTTATIIERARTEIALELGCEIDEVVFTSGATEANNLALRGVALAHPIHGGHLVTSEIEHKAVGSIWIPVSSPHEVTSTPEWKLNIYLITTAYNSFNADPTLLSRQPVLSNPESILSLILLSEN